MQFNFKEWLLKEDAGTPGAKQALYVLGYGGIGLYPEADVIGWSSDAITYMPHKARFLKFNWGDGILGNPFRKDSLYNSIEGKLAKQIQAGGLRADGKEFEKVPYIKETPLETVHVGALKKDDTGFLSGGDYVQKSKKKVSQAWDYTNIGSLTPDVQLLLPTKI